MNFGVVGFGRIAEKGFLPAIRRIPEARLVAVGTRSASRARELERITGVDVLVGYEALVARDDVETVYVGSPTGLHAEHVRLAANHGKHVLCEKTLTHALSQTEDVLKACAASGLAVMEGFMYRFHPQHEVVRSVCESGEIGELRTIEARYGIPPLPPDDVRWDPRLGGGALLDVGSYTIHVCRFLTGREPRVLGAVLEAVGRPVDAQGGVLLDLGGGVSGLLSFGFLHGYRNEYTVWGSAGHATAERAFAVPVDYAPSIRVRTQEGVRELRAPPCDQFARQIRAFVEGHADPATRAAWARDALAQMRVVENVRRAAAARAHP